MKVDLDGFTLGRQYQLARLGRGSLRRASADLLVANERKRRQGFNLAQAGRVDRQDRLEACGAGRAPGTGERAAGGRGNSG